MELKFFIKFNTLKINLGSNRTFMELKYNCIFPLGSGFKF